MYFNKNFVFFYILTILGIGGLIFLPNQAKAAVAGDVTINEIMWTGSTATDTDEWIELRNASSTAIDLANWEIQNAVHGATTTLTITSGFCSTTTIPASGYFLISNYSATSSSISNSVTAQCATDTINLIDSYLLNGALTLRQGATTIDQTPASSTVAWTAGSTGSATSSMARNYTPGSGTTTTNWHSSIISNNKLYQLIHRAA